MKLIINVSFYDITVSHDTKTSLDSVPVLKINFA